MDWGMFCSILVGVHLITEYGNYIYNFFSNQTEKEILRDILSHRRQSKKTVLLKSILSDLEEIKEKLGIEEKEEE